MVEMHAFKAKVCVCISMQLLIINNGLFFIDA